MSLKIQELKEDLFSPFGTYFKLRDGYNCDVISFIPDRITQHIGAPALVGISSIRICYRPLEITVSEYHNECEEVFGGFNCDTVFYVGLLNSSGNPDIGSIQVFRLPADTYVRLKRKIIHHAGFVLNKDEKAYGVVLLSPAAYTIDCIVSQINEPISILV